VSGDSIKIKGLMPIGPKPGNKYAALYAQKGVNVRIILRNQVPKAKWYNDLTGEYEELEFDIIFGPLAFPSRMTAGEPYEILFTNTIKYIYDLEDNAGTSFKELFLEREDDDSFNDVFLDHISFSKEMEGEDPISLDEFIQGSDRFPSFGLSPAQLIEQLTDCTSFIYNNRERLETCQKLRTILGIPHDGYYDLFYQDEKGEYTRKVNNPIFCGHVYYVKLPHLVDNKRRAAGYVGKKDAMTNQPKKGRKVDGGASTGPMEGDALKAYGARANLWERYGKVSDARVMLICSICSGPVSRSGDKTHRCLECGNVLTPDQVYTIEGVQSWTLIRAYARALGIEISETYG